MSFIFIGTRKKTLRLGAVPTINLPIESHATKKFPERRHVNIVQDGPSIQLEEEIKYKSFDDVVKKIRPLKLKGWTLTLNDTVISLKEVEKPFIVPKYELFIKEYLKFSFAVYGWLLPENQELYMNYNRSVKRITVTSLLNEICRYLLCEGADIKQVKSSDDVINHVTLLEEDINQPNSIHVKEVQRSKKCVVLYFDSTLNHSPAIKKHLLKDKRFAKNIKT